VIRPQLPDLNPVQALWLTEDVHDPLTDEGVERLTLVLFQVLVLLAWLCRWHCHSP
jgi:hypothetical protein